MISGLRILTVIVSALAFGRAVHSLWFILVAFMARGGEGQPLGTTAIIAQTLGHLSPAQYVIWSSYTLAYLAIPVLLLLRRKEVLWVAIYAVMADFGYWIWSGMQQSFAGLVSAGPVLSDAIINAVALAILGGVIILTRSADRRE